MTSRPRRRVDLYHRRLVRHVAPCLGFSTQQLASGEDPSRIFVRNEDDVDPADTPLRALGQGDLDRWFRLFGQALEIEVGLRTGSADRSWRARAASHDATALAELLAEADGRTDARLDVLLTVEKAGLVEQLRRDLERDRGPTQDVAIAFFVFGSALESSLASRDERGFETTFLAAGTPSTCPRALLVLLADQPGSLRGPHLAVLGGPDVAGAAGFLEAIPSQEPLRERWEVMKDKCQWDERTLCLTPDHLQLTHCKGLDACRGELVRLMNRLVLPFLANSTDRTAGGGLECVFEGERRKVKLAVGLEKDSSALLELYHWAYESPRESSRIAIVRHLIAAKEWIPAPDFKLLVENAASLREQCAYQLHLLIEDNVFETFQQRQQIADRIRAYTDGVSERIRGLSKEMVDNTYRTVGFLVAIALAYILDPDLESAVTTMVVVLYVLYIGFVYAFYVRALKSEFEEKKAEFGHEKKRLEAEKVGALQALFDGVEERNNAFTTRFGIVTTIYAFLVAMAIGLGYWLAADRPDLWLHDPRARALEAHAKRLDGLGYRDLRLDVKGHQRPDQLVDEASATTLLPDLTAIDPDDRLVAVVYLPCIAGESPALLDRLRRFRQAGAERHADLQLLTEAVCDGEPGHDRARRLLARQGMEPLVIWSR